MFVNLTHHDLEPNYVFPLYAVTISLLYTCDSLQASEHVMVELCCPCCLVGIPLRLHMTHF